jgi:hypothetical protein
VRRRLLIVAAAAAIALIAVPEAGARVRTVKTPARDVSGTRNLAEGEPTIAYNPRDRRNIIVGSNQWQPLTGHDSEDYIGLGPSGFTRCAAWSSADGGRSWHGGPMMDGGIGSVPNPLDVPRVPGEFDDPGNVFSADQNTVFDRTGTAYYTCINFGVKTGLEQLYVWRSADGGRHWSDPVAAFSQTADMNRQMDRPFLAIDRSTGRHGTLYLAWETIFYDPALPEVFVRTSTDGGRTWGHVVRVDNSRYPAMWDARLFPMVGADGTLYVIYDSAGFETPFAWHPQIDHPSLVLASSTDGGKTFSYHWVARDIHRPAPPDEDEPELTEFISSMATDPRRAGRVAVAWPERVHGESRILMRSSVDGGKTWGRTIDVADDPRLDGNQHDHVVLRYLPDGRIVVVWRDRRYTGGGWYDPYDILARVVRVRRDGSLDPGRSLRVTRHSQLPSTGHRGHMPSEYLGIAVKGSRGLGVTWEAMKGRYPDDVYVSVPLEDFHR